MTDIGKQIHDMGLKFGVFSAAGIKSCVSGAGSLAYEQTDAMDFAQWGVDYLKYGDCNGIGLPAYNRFTSMRDALNKTGRSIYYSIAKSDDNSVFDGSIANSWRTSMKAREGWDSVKTNFLKNNLYQKKAGPGAWNDPDLLSTGLGLLSNLEERTQFALWALSKAPLLLSVPLRVLNY